MEKRAKRRAAATGEIYKPITDRGHDLAQVRSVRARIMSALQSIRDAAAEILKIKRKPTNPFTDIEANEDFPIDDGLSM
jgi:hypothetical protein